MSRIQWSRTWWVLAIAAVVTWAGSSVAQPVLPENRLITEPLPIVPGQTLQFSYLNASDEPLTNLDADCFRSPNRQPFGGVDATTIEPGDARTFGIGGPEPGTLHCDIVWEGSCEALRVTTCVTDGGPITLQCATNGRRICQQPDPGPGELTTAVVQSARFRRAHCTVTNVGTELAAALVELIDADGDLVAADQLSIAPDDTEELVFLPYVTSKLRCRVTPAGDAALRARIYVEDSTSGAADASPAR